MRSRCWKVCVVYCSMLEAVEVDLCFLEVMLRVRLWRLGSVTGGV